ncbi:MAG TPA: hypothetical protein PLG57_04645 [Bacteroidia bacterium]|jgi:hypothetical protein|nr:hypothetical protein [Bacteroidia bacterium]HQF27512.1 hypothetical protein [Bacteroidia bacterium]HQK97729.1 hypothetical protein [Bacteroidia bacterium]
MKDTKNKILQVLGSVYIMCGLISYYFVGPKSKILLIVSICFGVTSWAIAQMQESGKISDWTGLGFTFFAMIVFSQRCLANIMALIGIIQNRLNINAYHKCIFIVLLSVMCAATISSLIQYYSLLESKKN